MNDAQDAFEGHFEDGTFNAALRFIGHHDIPTSPLYATLDVEVLCRESLENGHPLSASLVAERFRLTVQKYPQGFEETLEFRPASELLRSVSLRLRDTLGVHGIELCSCGGENDIPARFQMRWRCMRSMSQAPQWGLDPTTSMIQSQTLPPARETSTRRPARGL